MKMIAATKVTKAQRAMEAARVYGDSAKSLLDAVNVAEPEQKKVAGLIVVCSSDRGLCGGIHSSLTKFTKKGMFLISLV